MYKTVIIIFFFFFQNGLQLYTVLYKTFHEAGTSLAELNSETG